MRTHQIVTRLSLAASLVLGTGCYTLKPMTQATPEPGTVVALDINDAGRVALGGSIGPEVGQIEGRLLTQPNGEYEVAVSTVRFLRGGQQIWSGERVRVTRDQVGNSYVRRFDRGRTIALSAAVVAGVAAVVASRDLFGFGAEPDPPTEPPGGGEALRIPLRAIVLPLLRR